MTTQEVAEAIELWAKEQIGELSTWPSNPEDLAAALPIAYAEAQRKRKNRTGSGEFDSAIQNYQQTSLVIWEFGLTLLVTPDPNDEASSTLNSYVDLLTEDLGRNPTLGQRVSVASPYYDVAWQGEVEHPSGTVARAAVITMTIGEEE